jgi:hypothetical protein
MSNNGEIDTPNVIQRPCLNEANRPLVMVLHNLALAMEAFPRVLADIARTIQLAPDTVTSAQKKRIADAAREQGAVPLLAGAQAIEEA